MRISDWSSDVCSSDLGESGVPRSAEGRFQADDRSQLHAEGSGIDRPDHLLLAGQCVAAQGLGEMVRFHHRLRPDRKSVVQGKSVSVRVDLGGRRIIKKKKNK